MARVHANANANMSPLDRPAVIPVQLRIARQLVEYSINNHPDDLSRPHLIAWRDDFDTRWGNAAQLDDAAPAAQTDTTPSYDGIGQYRSRFESGQQ